MEGRREGLRVKALVGANRQAALPGRASDPGGPDIPAGTKVGRMVTLAPLGEEWKEPEEMVLRSAGEKGQDEEEKEGGPSPP